MRWLEHRGGAAALKSASRQGTDLPAAVVLGADPGTTIAAVAPVPKNHPNTNFPACAAEKLSLVKCKTVPYLCLRRRKLCLKGT